MTNELLETLRQNFGTVSGKTADSGIVAVRNKTAYKLLILLTVNRATLSAVTSPDSYPRLVRVTEVGHDV
jgi:hypothetical protein